MTSIFNIKAKDNRRSNYEALFISLSRL